MSGAGRVEGGPGWEARLEPSPSSARAALQGPLPPAASGRNPQGEAVEGQPGLPAAGREVCPVGRRGCGSAPARWHRSSVRILLLPRFTRQRRPTALGRAVSVGKGARGRSSDRVSWAVKRVASGVGAVLGSTLSPGRARASWRGRLAQTSSISPTGASVLLPRGAWPPLAARTARGAPALPRAGAGGAGRQNCDGCRTRVPGRPGTSCSRGRAGSPGRPTPATHLLNTARPVLSFDILSVFFSWLTAHTKSWRLDHGYSAEIRRVLLTYKGFARNIGELLLRLLCRM